MNEHARRAVPIRVVAASSVVAVSVLLFGAYEAYRHDSWGILAFLVPGLFGVSALMLYGFGKLHSRRLLDEQLYRSLNECTPDIIMSFDREGRHLYASPSVAPLTGRPPEEFIGKTHAELGFSAPLCRFFEESIRTAFDGGEPIEKEFEVDLNGRESLFNWRLVPVRCDGRVASVLSIARDITAQRKSERNYQMLFREMLEGFALHEIIRDDEGRPVDYRFLAVNPAFERLTGLRAEALVGRTVREALPGTEGHWIETYGRVAITGEAIQFENFHQDTGRHYQVSAYCPAPNQFACIVVDITQRNEAAEALRLSEARHARMVASIGDVIVIIDQEGVNRYCSPNIERWFGWRAEDLVGHDNWDHVHPADICISHEFFNELLAQPNISQTGECRFRCKDGSFRWIEFTGINLLHDPDIQGILGNFHDTSARKRVEEEREALRTQLMQAQKMESVGRLAGGVAHDFNNMLGVILGHVDMALTEIGVSTPLNHNLQEIEKAAQRSADLTRQLLAFARKQPVSPRILDLNVTLAEMFKMLQRLIGENIELTWRPGAGLWPVKIDPSQVDQILANMAVNARDAITGAGEMTIQTQNVTLDETYLGSHAGCRPGDFVMLMVADTGCGMDAATIEHVFEPFFTTKGVGMGTGLGLAMVYGAVKQNQGFINVYSEPGRGTCFKIYLPRADEPMQAPRKAPPRERPVQGTETVLLAEDEESILMLGRSVLEKHGYQVLAARTPAEALALSESHAGRIDVLVTDVVMPGMNGKELKDRLRAARPELKVLFMSGYPAEVIAHEGVLDHNVEFLQKPFTMATLTLKLRQVLSEPVTSPPEDSRTVLD